MVSHSPVSKADGRPNALSTGVQGTLTHRSGNDVIGSTSQGSFESSPNPPGPADEVENTTSFDSKKSSTYFGKGGKLRPFRLLKEDAINIKNRWVSDWQIFNQQVVASAIYIFFTNILPGITFASDLYTLTGKSWGTIEIVFSTGLCGLIFSL